MVVCSTCLVFTSQKSKEGWGCCWWSSQGKDWSQVSSQATKAMNLYYAFVENRDNVFFSLDSHDMRNSPKKMQYPETDLFVSGLLAQYELVKTLRWIREEAEKRRPCSRVILIYFKIQRAACICGTQGSQEIGSNDVLSM